MAREIFISYKYHEARTLRDEIIEKLGEDAKYYRGETASSPNIASTSVENIKNVLKDMIYGTSVTVIIISPSMINSEWIEWEIEYSLKEVTRQGRESKTNGLIGVIMKVNGSYDWLISHRLSEDGCSVRYTKTNNLFDIINDNRFNLVTDNKFSCPRCQTYSRLNGSYISLIEEHNFLADPEAYIENAYKKSKELWKYKLSKQS